MKVLVVTGGIGSGKSAACSILKRNFGWQVYEADSRVKHLYRSHPTLLSDLERELDMCLRDSDGNFTPQLLAERIFNDSIALSKVEEWVFPVLTDDFEKWKLQQDCDVVILESATILEKPQLSSIGDYKIIIDAPLDKRILRAARRDGIESDKIRTRARNQKLMNAVSSGLGTTLADEVIVNDGDIENLELKLASLQEKLR